MIFYSVEHGMLILLTENNVQRHHFLIEIKNSNSNKSGELEQATLDLLRPYKGEYTV